MAGKRKDISGLRIGRLVATCRIGRSGHHAMWAWRCDCGAFTETSAADVRRRHKRNGVAMCAKCLASYGGGQRTVETYAGYFRKVWEVTGSLYGGYENDDRTSLDDIADVVGGRR